MSCGKQFATPSLSENYYIMSENKVDPEAQENNASAEENTANTSTENATETATEEQEAPAPEPEKTPEMVIAELNDKYLRLYSEFDNYRKRTQREKVDLIKNAGADVIKEMLSILDDFERATIANEAADDTEGLKEGFTLIHNKFRGILERQGLKPMDSIGEAFNVDHHEAITKIPAPSEDMKGKVIDAVEKGYFLKERVLRYAKVVVGS